MPLGRGVTPAGVTGSAPSDGKGAWPMAVRGWVGRPLSIKVKNFTTLWGAPSHLATLGAS